VAGPRLLELQRTLADLILEGEDAVDPQDVAARHGLEAADQAAIRRFDERLLVYRELSRMSLLEPIADMFPVTLSLLESEGARADCLDSFLRARRVSSQHYRDIAPAFLGWLVETGWGQATWPFLPELAHFELLEVLVARYPDGPGDARLHQEPLEADNLVLDPATRLVAYAHAVHRATEEAPIPRAEPTYLLAFRDARGDCQVLELTTVTAALLSQAAAKSISDVARELGLQDLQAVRILLTDLRERGALAGFRALS